MADTFSQMHIHVVFAVKFREALIAKEWRNNLYMYITKIIQSNGHKLLAIGGTENHIHILIGMRPTQGLSDLILQVKRDSSEWINKSRLVKGVFRWQKGFGAFTYSKSQVKNVIRYILNQEEHHRKQKFRDEYVNMLKKSGDEYSERNLFDDV